LFSENSVNSLVSPKLGHCEQQSRMHGCCLTRNLYQCTARWSCMCSKFGEDGWCTPDIR